MVNWSLVENQPLLKKISKMPTGSSEHILWKRSVSIKDMLVRAKA